MSEWQPMETAPKDGTKILVVCVEDSEPEIEVTEWYTIESYSWEHVENDMYRRVARPAHSGWNGNGHRATHWMLLPPLPQRDGDER